MYLKRFDAYRICQVLLYYEKVKHSFIIFFSFVYKRFLSGILLKEWTVLVNYSWRNHIKMCLIFIYGFIV